MKSLLFALGLALCCFVQADQDQQPKDWDLSKIKGDWVFVGIITSCQKIQGIIPFMKASPVSLNQVSTEQVNITAVMKTLRGCETINVTLNKKNEVFVTRDGGCGTKTVKYGLITDNFAVFYITVKNKKTKCAMAVALVRDLAYTQEAVKELELFGGRRGLEDEEVHVLPTEGMCKRSP